MSRSDRPLRLNLGCGPGPQPAGWVHVDGSWNARLSRLPLIREALRILRVIPPESVSSEWTPHVVPANLRRPLPFEPGTVECVYASHVLEHLYEDDARALLGECYRVLKPHGVIRLVVPDLCSLATQYVETARSARADGGLPPAADRFVEQLLLRPRTRPRGHLLFRLYSAITDFHSHKWMYDAESLIVRVRHAGFTAVEQRGFLNSRIDGIEQVEHGDRVLDNAGICVEGLKP